MIDAINEASYKEAERIIAEAEASRATELTLDSLRIEELPSSLSKLTWLESLYLSQCHWLEDLSALNKLVALKKLDIDACGRVKDLSFLESLHNLRSLDLGSCYQVFDISALTKLPNLQKLNLRGSQVSDLSVLANLSVLQSLDLSWCAASNLSCLGNHPSLQSLSIYGGRHISDLSVLEKIPTLQSLNLAMCQQFVDLSMLTNLRGLKTLNLSWLRELSDLAPLKNLSYLESLDLSGCTHITDLSVLKNLPNLTSLDIGGCELVTDLSVLVNLPALTSLDISGCELVTDLSVLANLPALSSLNLSGCEQVTDLSVLENLQDLQSLELRAFEMAPDLSVLANLSHLQSLDLSSCKQVGDLSPLKNLSLLVSLDLSGCKQVGDLSPLKNLSLLESLDLSGCKQVGDLSPLKNLSLLRALDLCGCEQLTDISVLANLQALDTVRLRDCKHISDISALKKLPALISLDIEGCNQIADLAVLENHSALRHLSLSYLHSQVPLSSLTQLRWLWAGRVENSSLVYVPPHLTSLYCSDSFYINNAPPELFDEKQFENSLTELIPWQRDIFASGAAPNTELKIFVLGNGRVGKTQISRRLEGNVYDPSISSTHGIVLGRFEVLPSEEGNSSINANLWDFGGQDVYLGTHGLFLDARAVYIVAWNPDHENDAEVVENGVPMRNRPLGYWLEYIRSLAGVDAPIIVVQSQCDRESDVKVPPLPDTHGFNRLRFTSCSAKSGHGMELLVPEIRAAARLLRDRFASVQIPKSWVSVSEHLRKLRSEGHKSLTFSEFELLCQQVHGLSIPSVVAGYLHRTGQVFWRAGAFGNDLLLDQEWALEGIYALLERNEILPMIRESHGRFNLRQLQLTVWQKYDNNEQRLFLDMMKQCGTCFPLGNGQYVAAELLPSERVRRADIDAIWRDADVAARVELHYDFLHDGIIKAILCEIGEKAGNAGVYWRHGVCYFDRDARGAVRISANWLEGQVNTRVGLIAIEVEGAHAVRLAEHLVRSIQSIRIGTLPRIEWCIGQPEAEQKSHRQSNEADKEQTPFAGVVPDPSLGGRTTLPQGGIADQEQPIRRQRVLVIASEWQSHHGGLSTFNRELCTALAQLDNEVCCAVADASRDDIDNAAERKVTIIKAKTVSGEDSISGLLRKLPLPAGYYPEVIIGHSRITGPAAKSQQEDHYPKARRIHFIHMAPGEIEWLKGNEDAAQRAEQREILELDLARDADLVAAVGPRLLSETLTLIDQVTHEDRPKVVQFNPGFRIAERRPAPPHSLQCLMLGRAEDEVLKGVDIVAAAIEDIDATKLKQKPELIIRGAQSGTGTLLREKLIRKCPKLEVRVKEYSPDSNQIEADFRSAALALMPSRKEGFGLVALEALSVGTPVLVSENSGFAELLKSLMEQYEWDNYIVPVPRDINEAKKLWKDKIFNELRDVDASIRRANKLADILAESLSWRGSCERLLADLGRPEI